MIQWEAKYETGVKEIDHQHKWLVDFSNMLEERLIAEDKTLEIDHILQNLESYAKKHFHYEETCMIKWKCPFAEENKCAHQKFIEVYENFMERYNREGHDEFLAWKIHHMVEHWITDHICRIDVKLKELSNDYDNQKK